MSYTPWAREGFMRPPGSPEELERRRRRPTECPALEIGASPTRGAGVARSSCLGTAAQTAGPAVGTVGAAAAEGGAGGRVPHRFVDLSPGCAGHPPLLWSPLSCRSCEPALAGAWLERPEATTPGGRT